VLIQAPVAPLSTGLNRIMVPSDVNVNTFGDPGGRFGALGTTTQEPTMLLAIEGATVMLGSPLVGAGAAMRRASSQWWPSSSSPLAQYSLGRCCAARLQLSLCACVRPKLWRGGRAAALGWRSGRRAAPPAGWDGPNRPQRRGPHGRLMASLPFWCGANWDICRLRRRVRDFRFGQL
jgi:hypothetical protein